MSRVVILDTETTGLKQPEAVEIAWIELSQDINEVRNNPPDIYNESSFVSWFEQRYLPTKAIEEGASKVTGIYMKDVIDCPSIKTFVFPEDITYIIGHNIGYDHRVLNKPNVKLICTKELAQMFLQDKNLKNNKLTTIVEFLFEDGKALVENAHGALHDCKLVYLILHQILQKVNPTTVSSWEDLAKFCSQGKQTYEQSSEKVIILKLMPFGKHKDEEFKNIPTSYLSWLLNQDNLSPSLRATLVHQLADR